MQPRNPQEAERISRARQVMVEQELGVEDDARIILVDENTTLVVNNVGFDPHTWPKKTWRKSKPYLVQRSGV